MSSGEPVTGVVVAHGPMARAMVEAVRRIAGDAADALHPLSNDGKGPTELKNELDAVLGEGPAVVFVDLQAGSCGMAAMLCCRETSRRAVVSGVNLPMLLDFVFHVDSPLDEIVDRVVEKGRDSIRHPTGARASS